MQTSKTNADKKSVQAGKKLAKLTLVAARALDGSRFMQLTGHPMCADVTRIELMPPVVVEKVTSAN